MLTLADVVTGANSALYISGPERISGIPQKAIKRLRLVGGGLERNNTTLFSNAKRQSKAPRNLPAPGPSAFAGNYQVEVTAEAGFPRFANMAMALVDTQTTNLPVTHYTHTFSNDFGVNTYTLYHVKGNKIFIYPGSLVTGEFNFAIDKTAGEVLAVSAAIGALDEIIITLADIPTALSDLGISTAGADILSPYSPVQAEATLANQYSPIRSVNANLALSVGMHDILNARRGASGMFEKTGDATATATSFFENMSAIYLDQGVTPQEVEGGASATTMAMILAAFRVDFYPKNNGSGYSNALSFVWPHNKIKVVEQEGSGTGNEETTQNLTVETVDDGTDPLGEYYFKLTNGESGTSILTPSAILPSVLLIRDDECISDVKRYEYGPADAGATTTVITVSQLGLFRPTADYYVGRELMLLEGANAGQTRTIIDYAVDGVTGAVTFTVDAAFTAAPTTGQHVGVVIR